MCWGFGLTISAGILRVVLTVPGDWGWRLPISLQWIWPLPLFVAAYFAPESPWNAVRRGNIEEARKSLYRLRNADGNNDHEVETTLAYIRYTTELERAETENANFIDCFKGTNLRRTEIVSIFPLLPPLLRTCSMPWAVQLEEFADIVSLEHRRLVCANLVWQRDPGFCYPVSSICRLQRRAVI